MSKTIFWRILAPPNPDHASCLLKYPENIKNHSFSDVFSEYKTDQWHKMG